MDNKAQPIIDDELIGKINSEIISFAEVIEKPCPNVWFIKLKEYELLGFFSCENNEEDLMTPTISMSLGLCDITDISKEGLFELFSLNGDLHGCTLSAEQIDGQWILFINRRIMVVSYQPGELYNNIQIMLDRFLIFQDQFEKILSNCL